MCIHFFEVLLILMFVFGYSVPFLLLLFGLIMYIEHIRFSFVNYLANREIANSGEEQEDKK